MEIIGIGILFMIGVWLAPFVIAITLAVVGGVLGALFGNKR